MFIDAPDRAVTCLDLASGSVVWRCTDYKAREASGMSADGKRFYVKTMDGELLAIDTARTPSAGCGSPPRASATTTRPAR